MPTSSYIPGDRRLLDCSRWPTYQVLAPGARARLDGLLGEVRGTGLHLSRADLVGALILHGPGDRDSLREALEEYRLAGHDGPPGERRAADGVMLRLPSPISRRLAGQIELIRDGGEMAFRRELVGAFIFSPPLGERTLPEACRDYLEASAADAGLSALKGRFSVLIGAPHRRGPRST